MSCQLRDAILSHYARQTALPKEVIISFSQVDLIPRALLNEIETHSWPFEVILIRNKQRTSAGRNRNLGVQRAKGDIIMFNDGDDLPHPQRVELVLHVFKKYNIYHLMHLCIWMPTPAGIPLKDRGRPQEFPIYDNPDQTIVKRYPSYHHIEPGTYFHNGQVCVLRKIALQIAWPEHFQVGEDVQYNQQVYAAFPDKTIMIHAPLVLYRFQLTSGAFDR